jgi:hypothetical protein
MPAYTDLTAFGPAMKELYGPQQLEFLMADSNPAFALIPKYTKAGGKNWPQPTVIGGGQGRSATFATAQANQTAPKITEFLCTYAQEYQLATIDSKTMMATQGDAQAFLSAIETQMDSALITLNNHLGSAIYRSGTGSIGKIASGGITGGVITLDDPNSVVGFDLNMALQANASDGGATPRAAVGYVVAIDEAAGKISVSATVGGSIANPGSWAAGDYLVVQGDNNNLMIGFQGWLPEVAPTTGDNFFGVDRSVHSRLYGLKKSYTDRSIEESLIDGAALIRRAGGRPTHCFLNPVDYAAFDKSLLTKTYIDVKHQGDVDISFPGISLQTPGGRVEVISDRNCPSSRAFILQLDTWKLVSIGPCPHTVDDDKNNMLRVANADAVEVRIRAYPQLVCRAPGWNANLTLPTAS